VPDTGAALPSRSAPVVSVVIAAFDAEDTLGEQLAALSRQVVPFAFEVLVCDNGSTDGTIRSALSWADRLPLRVIDASARRGPGAARNAGAAAASGTWLVFCDADDIAGDDWLSEMHAGLQGSDFLTGTSRRLIPGAQAGATAHLDFSTYRMPFFPQLPVAGAGNIGIRRELFLAVGGFDETLHAGEDLDLSWRLQLAGHRLDRRPTAVIAVRNRPNLRATFRQAYGYGVGDKRLRHKYADVIAAFRGLPNLPVAFDGPVGGAEGTSDAEQTGPAGRVTRRLRRLFDDLRPARLVPRCGTRLGGLFGSVARSAPRLAPPADPETVGR
jgi:glycosyltransferase involved in cell wall biosynthesis